MPVTLNPDQQAKLDQFESDAQAASDAEAAATSAAEKLLTAQADKEHAMQVALDDHAAALSSAQAFIDAMMGRPTPLPVNPTPAK